MAVRRGSRAYLIASVVAVVSGLLRYVVLARLLGPEQLGLASILIVTWSFLDFMSDTAMDRFLILSRDDTPAVQELVHFVSIGRAVLVSAALVIVAGPVAAFYRDPRLVHGIMALALAPLLLGIMHFDIKRVQQHLDFRAEARSLALSETASFIGTASAAYLTHDYTAILYGLILRSAVIVLISHVQAEWPYRLGFSRQHAGRLALFSAPLMANGLLTFLSTQGDRVVVANLLGVKELGYYSAIVLLIYYPSSMLVRYTHAMYLPLIAACRDHASERREVVDRLAGQTLLLSVAMAIGFAVVAPFAVGVLFGHRFVQAPELIALIGVLQTCRYMAVWPTTTALGIGHSSAVLAINIVRLIAYPSAIVGGWAVGGLPGVVVGFIAGEAASLLAGTIITNRAQSEANWKNLDRLLLFAFVCTLVFCGTIIVGQRSLAGGVIVIAAMTGLLGLIIRRERDALVAGLERVLASIRGGMPGKTKQYT
jgi:O-antigen/teichoic acid export membrane protein